MNKPIDFEAVSAYIDGALDADRTRELELAAVDDAEVREARDAFRQADQFARAVFDAPLGEPMPIRLPAAIRAGFAARRVAGRSAALRRWALPLAASVLIALSGLFGGYTVSEWRLNNRLAALEAARAADLQMVAVVFQDTLEKVISGTPVNWQGAATKFSGTIKPTRTYQSASKHWCREFEERIDRGDIIEIRRGLACRQTKGGWRRLQTTIVGDAPPTIAN